MRQGQTSLQVLIYSTLILIVVTGFAVWGGSLVNISLRGYNRLQTLQVAEAGIEYYRWHLAHAANDYQDGTGHAGPYVHNYFDKNGNVIGTFSLTITPPPLGSSVVTVKSTGSLIADPSVQKVVQARFGIASYARFAVLSNDNIRFGPGTEVFGPLMSNGGIHFDGLAHNLVQSALTTYTDPDVGTTQWAVYTAKAPADSRPPTPFPARPDVFAGGRQIGVPAVDFAGITQNLSNIKTQAQASGVYLAPSGASGYDLLLNPAGTYTVYKVTALAAAPNNCTNSANQAGWGTWSIKTETQVATGTFPGNGLFFFEDNLWVRGQINGARLMIASGKFPDNVATRTNITINTNLTYTNYDGTDAIGILAQNNINVGLMSDTIFRIDGALVAENGRAGRYYYASANCGATVVRNTLTLFGSLISSVRYGFAYTDGTGYQTRNINYDSNLLYGPPPQFPTSATQYTLISWNELQ